MNRATSNLAGRVAGNFAAHPLATTGGHMAEPLTLQVFSDYV